jgi:cytochrome c oxidase subunit 3
MGVLTKEEKRKVRKPMLWIGLASIAMTFAGLTSGYVVSRSSLIPTNKWLQFELPHVFYYATAAIVFSSICMFWAQRQAKADKSTNLPIILALAGGLSFVYLQYVGAQDLISRGLYFSGGSSSVSWVYVIAGLHWLHVVSGIIVLLVTLIQSLKGAYTSNDHYGLDLSAIYWHFLDLLWIYLFFFLAFIR